jgi:hypothetical protein
MPVSGQKLINSPFSRFNIGTMEPAGSFRSQAMGGISISQRDNNNIYYSNPASYSSLDTNSFVFDFGFDYSKNKISDGTSYYLSDDMNFDHLIMGFPIAKGFGFALGIVPFSNGYYRIREDVTSTSPGYDPIVGPYASLHNGSGGFTNFFAGSGIKLNRNFSAGVNMNILFGQIDRANQFDFADFYNSFHDNSLEKLQVTGINLDYGLQYTTLLKAGYFFNAGLSLTSGKHYKTDYEKFVYKFTSFGTADTINYSLDKSKSTFIPGTYRAGISFGQVNKFSAGLDFILSKWSDSVIPGSEGFASDSKKVLFGLEFTPDKFSNYSYLKRMDYRMGAHSGSDYLKINGEQVKEMGASFGLGFPMPRSLSKTNIFFDYTKRSGAGMSEEYFTIGLSINLHDFWFAKRKYN